MTSRSIAARVPVEMYEQIEAIAERENQTVTDVVQGLLEGALRGGEKERAVKAAAVDKNILEGVEKRLTAHLLNNLQMAVRACFYAREGAGDASDLAIYFEREIDEMEDRQERSERYERQQERLLEYEQKWREKVGIEKAIDKL